MIICMSDVFCITNRTLCEEDFLVRIDKIAKEHPGGIILREKDLSEKEYLSLAKQVLAICQKYNTPCVLHSFTGVARELNCEAIHLPLPVLRMLSDMEKRLFTTIGVSCHFVEEAKEAERMGCTYIIAGHIFETDCKKGLAGRGLAFLHEVCESVTIPVYAIGGINAQNVAEVRKMGAAGVCVMSGMMNCEYPAEYLMKLK